MFLPFTLSSPTTPHCQSRRHEATGVHIHFGSAGLLQLCPCRAASEIAKVIGTSNECCRRLVMGLRPRDHITEAMHNLHWLPLTYRIKYKLCLMMYAAVNGRCPTYISELIRPVADIARRARLYARQQHINSTFHAQEPNLASRHSQSWRLCTGMNFRFNCDNAAEWLHSNDNLKLITSILL